MGEIEAGQRFDGCTIAGSVASASAEILMKAFSGLDMRHVQPEKRTRNR